MKWIRSRKHSVVGALVLLAVGLVLYRPSLDIAFWTDDYDFLDKVGRLALPEYLAAYFDPTRQWQWYRPLQGMMWWVVNAFLGKDPFGYHLAQVALHIANTVILYALVTRVTGRWRLAWLSALLYVTLPAYSLAVFWPGVADPLAALFGLLTVWFWVGYLKTGNTREYVLALAAFIAALLSKEVSAVVPPLLFLVDVWLIEKGRGWLTWLKRYAVFGVILLAYAALEFTVITRGLFTQGEGYGIGSHILEGLQIHIGRLAFPWGLPAPLQYVWLALLAAAGIWLLIRRNKRALFVVAAALLPTLPILPFPVGLAQASRYLYVPLMASAVGFGWLVDTGLGVFPWQRIRWAALLGLAGFFALNGAQINEGAINFAGSARQARQVFRPVFQMHTGVEPGTMLYFVNPPTLTPYISGMAYQRYGTAASVYGTDRDQFPILNDYTAAYVYYVDEQNNWQESSVEKSVAVEVAPPVPARFGTGISLDAIQLVRGHVRRGDAVVLLLYWRNTGRISKDYSVFVHLVDANGTNQAGYDGQPRQGYSPTSKWRNGERLADSAVIQIDSSIPAGEYVLELGLYDPSTMERLTLNDARGSSGDKITIGPVYIVD